MNVTAELVEALVGAGADAAVLDPGNPPYLLAGDTVIELARPPATPDEMDELFAEVFSADSLQTFVKMGAVQQRLPPMPDFPGQHFMLTAVRIGEQSWLEIRRERAPAPAPPVEPALEPATRHVPSGVPGLDARLGGGLPVHRTVLLSGGIGTGKTTFGLQFLMEGAKRGDAGVFVSVDENPKQVIEDARRFGWDVHGAIDRGLVTLFEASQSFAAVRGTSGLDARALTRDLTRQIRRVNARRVVIDAANALVLSRATVTSAEEFLRSLIASLEDHLGCTIVLNLRTSGDARTSPVGTTAERLSAGVIELQLRTVERRARRSMVVRKMPGASTALGEWPFDFVEGRGLVVRKPERGAVA